MPTGELTFATGTRRGEQKKTKVAWSSIVVEILSRLIFCPINIDDVVVLIAIASLFTIGLEQQS